MISVLPEGRAAGIELDRYALGLCTSPQTMLLAASWVIPTTIPGFRSSRLCFPGSRRHAGCAGGQRHDRCFRAQTWGRFRGEIYRMELVSAVPWQRKQRRKDHT